MNPYKVLGIRPNASLDEIKDAYESLANTYSINNFNGSPEEPLAEDKISEINEAYSTLTNNFKYKNIRNLIENKQFLSAETELNLISDKTSPEWNYLQGFVLLKKGWFNAGVNHLKTAAELNPNNEEYQEALMILFQKVREELGLCYSVYSYMQPYLGVGTMNIYTGLSNKYCDKAISVINEHLYDFASKGISKELLEINKEKIKASYILGLESTSSRMFANAKCFLLQNKIKTQEDVIKRINKIDNDDINYVLERCFKPGIISTAFVGQGIEADKLNSIVNSSKVAYKNCADEKFLL